MIPPTAPLLKQMRGADGKATMCDHVWISYFTGNGETNGEGFGKLTAGYGSRQKPAEDGGKIGPEFTFGLTMDEGARGARAHHQDCVGRQVAVLRLSSAERRGVSELAAGHRERPPSRGADADSTTGS